MLKAYNPTGGAWPGLSQGIAMQGSGIFMTSGQCGVDENGRPIADMRAQIEAMFERVKAVLATAGLGFENVARASCFVKEITPEILKIYADVRKNYYNMDCPPASVVVQAALYDPSLFAEMEVIAVIP